jgi:hypothetical protein
MEISKSTTMSEVLDQCNNVDGREVIMASQWKISWDDSQAERKVLCKWADRQYHKYVIWTQFLVFPMDTLSTQSENYKTFMTCGSYFETEEEATKVFNPADANAEDVTYIL